CHLCKGHFTYPPDRGRLGHHFSFPSTLPRYVLEERPQFITLIFDNTDYPSPAEYLQQFEKSLNIQSLPSKERIVSTNTLIDHILPQVVILNRPIGLDEVEYIRVVVMGKTDYKALLEGKLRDTVVFWGRVDDEQTGGPGKLDFFSYYVSPLSDYVYNMRSHDGGFRVPDEMEEVIRTILRMHDDLNNYQRRTDYYSQ
ncbi:MAG: hypothetical protein ACFFC6_18375, partial [Promethearchaeota archaeon]